MTTPTDPGHDPLSTRAIVLTVPGLWNSNQDHWQSLWEAEEPTWKRIQQADWETPLCADWVWPSTPRSEPSGSPSSWWRTASDVPRWRNGRGSDASFAPSDFHGTRIIIPTAGVFDLPSAVPPNAPVPDGSLALDAFAGRSILKSALNSLPSWMACVRSTWSQPAMVSRTWIPSPEAVIAGSGL